MNEIKTDVDPSPGSGKRKRAPNFTDKEIKLLMQLVFEHINIIECKKTDSETWRVKDIVWNNVAQNFNNSSGTTKRTVETVRQKYDSIKKLVRKKDAKNRYEELKAEPDFIDMEEYEKELLRVLETVGNNGGLTYEPSNLVIPETNFSSNIKTENTNNSSRTFSEDPEDPQQEETRFTITDEDMLWDLPTDTIHRPRLTSLKKHLEYRDKEEQRLVEEHNFRMHNHRIKRKIMLNKERRLKAEHQRRMELLEIELELKRRVLEKENNTDVTVSDVHELELKRKVLEKENNTDVSDDHL